MKKSFTQFNKIFFRSLVRFFFCIFFCWMSFLKKVETQFKIQKELTTELFYSSKKVTTKSSTALGKEISSDCPRTAFLLSKIVINCNLLIKKHRSWWPQERYLILKKSDPGVVWLQLMLKFDLEYCNIDKKYFSSITWRQLQITWRGNPDNKAIRILQQPGIFHQRPPEFVVKVVHPAIVRWWTSLWAH